MRAHDVRVAAFLLPLVIHFTPCPTDSPHDFVYLSCFRSHKRCHAVKMLLPSYASSIIAHPIACHSPSPASPSMCVRL